jgi:hypothetical protein
MGSNRFFTSTTAGSIGAENLVSEINTNAVTLLASTKLDNTTIPILLETSNSHVHHTFLTQTEAINLMKGVVASVVKTSSTDSSHSHSVTITYDSLVQCFFASGASGGSPAHTHTGQPQNNTATVPVFHIAGSTGHIHVSWLTMREANDLMQGTVASVVKNSSTNSFHAHATTITWDSVRSQFNAVSDSAGSPAHVHGTAAAGMSPFGASFYNAISEAESTTTSTSFQTKVTMTTGSLPLGDYVFFWTCGASNSGAKQISVEARRNSTRLRLAEFETSLQSAVGQYNPVGGFHYMSQISGVQTFDLRHRTVNGNTARIGDAHIMIFRIQ